MTQIGSTRCALSSRTAWMTRIAGSPRLTIARREIGGGMAQSPPIAARIGASASASTPPGSSIVR